MQTVTNPLNNRSTASESSYPPSVPLSVYRQLAIELQTAQGKINQLNATNKQLSQENQLLRQEISKVIESVGSLQSLLISPEAENLSSQVAANILRQNQNQRVVKTRPVSKSNTGSSSTPKRSSNIPAAANNWQPPTQPTYTPISETFYIEEQEVRYDHQRELDANQLHGWRLVIGIFLIILTAFGAGYLIVRPLLEIRSR